MKHAVIATFFDTLEGARKECELRRKNWKRRFGIVASKGGFLVISEDALKKAGLIPRRKVGKKLSPDGDLQ